MEQLVFRSAFDGRRIIWSRIAAVRPVATLTVVHGMAEHRERYSAFLNAMAQRGISCYIEDHRGHGASAGNLRERGIFGENGASALLSDLRTLQEIAGKETPDVPHWVLGHSMGALAVRAWMREPDFAAEGVILTGNPGYSPAAPSGIKLARAIEKRRGPYARAPFLALGMTIPFWLKAPGRSRNAWICSDPSVVCAYDADPYCGFAFGANGFEALFRLMLTANAPAVPFSDSDMPVFFLSGEKDPCMAGRKRLAEAADLLRACGLKRVETELIPGMRHEILNEKGKTTVWDRIGDLISEGRETV